MNNKWQNAVRSMEQRMESLRLNMHGYQILYRGGVDRRTLLGVFS